MLMYFKPIASCVAKSEVLSIFLDTSYFVRTLARLIGLDAFVKACFHLIVGFAGKDMAFEQLEC